MRSASSCPVLLLVIAVFSGCTCKKAEPPAPDRVSDDVRPAFEGDPKLLDGRAVKLCNALHQLPAERRATCCQRAPQVHFGNECARVVSLALEAKTIELAGVDACLAALTAAYDGCDWVGPNEVPLPSACTEVLRGKLASRKACRSTLECEPGLHCRGAGPTARGTCVAPGAAGMACELSVDVLVSYTRSAPRPHTECAGSCERHRCEDVTTDGGACTLDAQCPSGQRCAGTCVAGAQGASGEACVPGGCVEGLRCVAGTCTEPLASGAECVNDLACRGACLATDGGRRCAPGC